MYFIFQGALFPIWRYGSRYGLMWHGSVECIETQYHITHFCVCVYIYIYIYILYITKSRNINKCLLNLKIVKENKSFTMAIMSVCNLSLKNHIIWKTCIKKTWKIQNIKGKVQCSIFNKIQPRLKRQSFSYHKERIKNSCTLELPSVLYSIYLMEMIFF
jgi:hypothetical protein